MPNEYYTPERILGPARRVLGGIDYDPCSCSEANIRVMARTYSTVETGPDRRWLGKVWVNPPYTGEGYRMFGQLLLEELSAGRCAEALWLSPLTMESVDIRALVGSACRVCLLSFRPLFHRPGGGTVRASRLPLFVAGFNVDLSAFDREFSALGEVMCRA